MPTPFPVNATLTFRAIATEPAIDALGNLSGAGLDLVVTAYLKRANQSREAEQLQGGEVARVAVEGRIDSVQFGTETLDSLPASILPGQAAEIIISDPAGVASDLHGQFYLEASPASAFGTSAVLGAPIKGFILIEVAWAEAL